MTSTITAPRKKILYVITKGNRGGAQRYVFDLAAALPSGEFETIIACGNEGALTEKSRETGIRVVLLRSLQRDISFGKEFAALYELIRLFRKEQPDIIHLNSSKAAFLGSLAARLFNLLRTKDKGLRIIFTVHGWPFNEQRNTIWKGAVWCASYLTALLATRVIVLSQGDFAQGIPMPFVRRKLHLILNGITETKMLSRETARAQLNTEQGKPLPDFWIGTIAELNRNKGIGYLMEAFAQLMRPATLCIIGGGEERKRLETLAEKLGIADRVLFAGFREDAARYLKAFDIFALPSLKEGLPYVLLEAGAAALPVVATFVGGIPDLIEDKKTGRLVPPKDPTGLVDAIRELLEQKETREKLGLALKERVEKVFSFERMLAQTVRLYK